MFKNLKNHKFSFTGGKEKFKWQLYEAARALNFLKKLANRILETRSKKYMHWICRFFHEKNFHRPPLPQIPLIVKALGILGHKSVLFKQGFPKNIWILT